MDKVKTILTLIAVILVALVALAAISLVYSALFYLLLFAIIGLGTVVAFRVLRKSDSRQLDRHDPQLELRKVDRILDEYRRK